MLLSSLLHELDPLQVRGELNRRVSGVWHDSRRVGADDIFVAIRGAQVDGRRFVPGLQAAAVIADGPVQARDGVTVIQVADCRQALARAAAALAGHPGRKIPVVGVTGTNGKTTTTWLVEAAAQAAGRSLGVIGTTGHRIAGRKLPASHTTPEAPLIQQLIGQAHAAGCAAMVMEASSIGLDLRRVDAIPFQVGAFTSFSRDHLDFHGSMTAYLAAKQRLFDELLDPTGSAVLYGDDPRICAIRPSCQRVWRYGRGPHNDLRATAIEHSLQGTRARISTPMGEHLLQVGLIGQHNLENSLAALGIGLALGWPIERCLAGLAALAAVPGRLEPVPNHQGLTVLVDYAHTPDALRQVLGTLSSLCTGRLLTVFGCGGDRDPGKRPLMGRAASEHSDLVFVTSDNPRSEDPAAIISQILPGLSCPDLGDVDRTRAIQRAIDTAQPGDVVLIAGKGHESGQIIGDQILPYDDREVAEAALRHPRPPGPGEPS